MSTRNKNSSPFGIISFEGPYNANTELVLPNHTLTHAENYITGEVGRQNLIMEGQRVKTLVGSAAIEDIEANSIYLYQDLQTRVNENYQRIADESYAGNVAEFNRAALQNGGRALLRAAAAGAENINDVISMSLNVRPPPSLLRRLLG